MKLLLYISDAIIPILLFIILFHALLGKGRVYEDFLEGAKDGFHTVIGIMPTLIGLMCAVGVLRASGFLDFLGEQLGNISSAISFPGELVPLTILRMFSSSAATGLLLDLYKEYGTDSHIGLTASLMMCCTETIFYTMSLYFMTAGIKKTRHTLCGALLSTFAGIAASVMLANLMLAA